MADCTFDPETVTADEAKEYGARATESELVRAVGDINRGAMSVKDGAAAGLAGYGLVADLVPEVYAMGVDFRDLIKSLDNAHARIDALEYALSVVIEEVGIERRTKSDAGCH